MHAEVEQFRNDLRRARLDDGRRQQFRDQLRDTRCDDAGRENLGHDLRDPRRVRVVKQDNV